MAVTHDDQLEVASEVSAFTATITSNEPSLWNNQFETLSDFAESYVNETIIWKSADIQQRFQKSFVSLLNRRQGYLDGLHNLNREWITGGGEVPNSNVILAAKTLLRYIENQARIFILNVIPRLVIGPLPSGGITVELHAEEDSALFVTIKNNETVEIDVKYRGYYTSIDTDQLGLGNKVLSRYESISE